MAAMEGAQWDTQTGTKPGPSPTEEARGLAAAAGARRLVTVTVSGRVSRTAQRAGQDKKQCNRLTQVRPRSLNVFWFVFLLTKEAERKQSRSGFGAHFFIRAMTRASDGIATRELHREYATSSNEITLLAAEIQMDQRGL